MTKKDFSSIESLDNWVKWQFFRGELKWSSQETAYEMDVNERRLLEWVDHRKAAMQKVAKSQIKKVEKLKESLRQKYVTKDEAKREVEFDIKKAVKYLDDGLSIKEIADKFNIKYADFILAWNKKIQLLNNEWRRQNR